MQVELVKSAFVDLSLLDVKGMPLGAAVTDVVAGKTWTLAASTAAVDHTTVESVSGAPDLRWLVDVTPTATAAAITAALAVHDTSLGSVRCFYTAEIDFAATPTGVVLIPAIAGATYERLGGFIVITAVGGVLTGSPTLKAGNNASFDNVAASQSPSFAGAFAAGAGGFVAWTAPAAAIPVSLATPVTVSVTVAATGTGPFVCKGKMVISLGLFPSVG